MTPKTIIVVGENSDIFHQLRCWLPDYRLVPVLPKQGDRLEHLRAGLVLYLVTNNSIDPFLWLKQQTWLHKIPTLIIQAEGSAKMEDLAEAFTLGLADFCEWPCSMETLCHKVSVHFKKASWWQLLLQKLSHFWNRSRLPAMGAGIIPIEFQLPQKRAFPSVHIPEKGIYVNFLGHFSIRVDQKCLPDDLGKKQKSLLAYILYHSGQFLHREKIMETFWPGVPADSSRNSLNVAISQIRTYLRPYLGEDTFISYQNEGYVVNPGLSIVTDVHQFKASCRSGWEATRSGQQEAAVEFLEQASCIYQLDFMIELQYEEWCLQERDALKETFLSVLNSLAMYYHKKRQYKRVIPLAERILTAAPFLEDVHCLLIDCYDRLNMRGRALNQYQKCKSLLATHFQVEPSNKTQALVRRVRGMAS